MPATDDLSITITAADYGEVMAKLKAFDPKLRTELRKSINKAARTVVTAQRKAIMATNSSGTFGSGHATRAAHALSKSGYTSSGLAQASGAAGKAIGGAGLRSSVARSLRVINRDSSGSSGVRVTAESSRMPAGQQQLPRAMNTGQWRHPVFGNRENWTTQTVSPPNWFYEAGSQQAPAVYQAIREAMAAAIAATGSGP